MSRPDFLSSPEAWTRASRIGVDRIQHACAVQRFDKPKDGWNVSAWLMVALMALCGFAAWKGWL